ncbi:MAG: hypothetical protein HYV40_06755 [Candidatus Levybacteria bacterium]|nr:hypothetical protein [Candidatus Levybacteria bacterium]
MEYFSRDQALVLFAILVLFLTLFINWTDYSWLILLAIILLLFAWYIKKVDRV